MAPRVESHGDQDKPAAGGLPARRMFAVSRIEVSSSVCLSQRSALALLLHLVQRGQEIRKIETQVLRPTHALPGLLVAPCIVVRLDQQTMCLSDIRGRCRGFFEISQGSLWLL